MTDAGRLLEPILALHDRIRGAVVEACTRQASELLASVASEVGGDTIYAIDRVGEETLVQGLGDLARTEPLCLVAEGLPGGVLVLPREAREQDCRWRLLVDPIDGTRGLMYQKRSGWILSGLAPNRGAATRLRDIVLAVQTEIPLVKQHLSDQLWALRGRGMEAQRLNRLSGARERLTLRPSRFEDQYASTGGELYELIAGHDRLVADLRPLMQPVRAASGLPPGLCCHPYDLCTALIAEEAGVIVRDPSGTPVDAPFDVTADVAWVGYANDRLRGLVEPVLQGALRRRGLLPSV